MNTDKEVAKILISIEAVAIKPKEPFRYTSGLLSPVYSDMRLLMSYPEERRRIIDLWINEIEKLGDFDVIAGTATGAIPHAAWISEKMNKPMVYIRGKAKEHGKQNQVEGLIKEGQRAVIVEDLISTGKSSLESVEALKNIGAEVNNVCGIFSYTLPQSEQNFKNANIKLTTLTTFPIIVEQALNDGLMKEEDKDLVLDWLNDSAGWAKRNELE